MSPMERKREAEWLTPLEAAQLKGVSRQAVTKAIRGGRLPAENWQKRYRLRRKAVEAWTPAKQAGWKKEDEG